MQDVVPLREIARRRFRVFHINGRRDFHEAVARPHIALHLMDVGGPSVLQLSVAGANLSRGELPWERIHNNVHPLRSVTASESRWHVTPPTCCQAAHRLRLNSEKREAIPT